MRRSLVAAPMSVKATSLFGGSDKLGAADAMVE